MYLLMLQGEKRSKEARAASIFNSYDGDPFVSSFRFREDSHATEESREAARWSAAVIDLLLESDHLDVTR